MLARRKIDFILFCLILNLFAVQFAAAHSLHVWRIHFSSFVVSCIGPQQITEIELAYYLGGWSDPTGKRKYSNCFWLKTLVRHTRRCVRARACNAFSLFSIFVWTFVARRLASSRHRSSLTASCCRWTISSCALASWMRCRPVRWARWFDGEPVSMWLCWRHKWWCTQCTQSR